MATDVAITAGQNQATPLPYVVPGAQEIIVKSCYASFDGTGAGGTFLPVVQFISPAGNVVAVGKGQATTAGDVADVSFFPRSSPAASSSGGITEIEIVDDFHGSAGPILIGSDLSGPTAMLTPLLSVDYLPTSPVWIGTLGVGSPNYHRANGILLPPQQLTYVYKVIVMMKAGPFFQLGIPVVVAYNAGVGGTSAQVRLYVPTTGDEFAEDTPYLIEATLFETT